MTCKEALSPQLSSPPAPQERYRLLGARVFHLRPRALLPRSPFRPRTTWGTFGQRLTTSLWSAPNSMESTAIPQPHPSPTVAWRSRAETASAPSLTPALDSMLPRTLPHGSAITCQMTAGMWTRRPRKRLVSMETSGSQALRRSSTMFSCRRRCKEG